MNACERCDGIGRLRHWVDPCPSGHRTDWRRDWRPCPRCEGTGDVDAAAVIGAARRVLGRAWAAAVADELQRAFDWLRTDHGCAREPLRDGFEAIYRSAHVTVRVSLCFHYDDRGITVSAGPAAGCQTALDELLRLLELPPVDLSLPSTWPLDVGERLDEAAAALRAVLRRVEHLAP